MKRIMYLLKTGLFLALSFVVISCQVGLGEAVDLTPPELVITSPSAEESVPAVPKYFTLKGRASDNIGVTNLTVTIEESNDQYKWDGSWKHLENNEWVKYENATFNGTAAAFEWSLTISFEGTPSGQDRTIAIRVTDANKNEGPKSKEDRIVTVDIKEPSVSIIEPILTTTYTVASQKYSEYKLKDNSVLSHLLNGDIKIAGSQKEDSKLDRLYIMIDKGTSSTLPSESVKALCELSETEKAELKDVILADITGSRNWEINIPEADIKNTFGHERQLLRLVTESHDYAGNFEQKVQGWFIYDSRADIPWIVANFGADPESASFPSNSDEYPKVYPSCKLQEYIYDDDGISTITVKTEVFENDIWTLLNEPVVYDLSSERNPAFKNIEITAISDNKIFRITTSCTDINGLAGTSIVRYLGVTDVNPPSLTIDTPQSGNSLFKDSIIDASGNMKISGKVVDDGEIESLKMIRVANKNTKNMLNYWNSENWTISNLNSGDKLFNLPLYGDNDPIEGYYTKYFGDSTHPITFNIFTDFGISSSETISTLNLIFMATDKSGSSTINSISLQGDIEAPALSIDKMTVIKSDATTEDYPFIENNSEVIPTLKTFSKANSVITDKIKLSGRWNDNSTDLWEDNKISPITVTCGNINFIVTKNSDGTWETDAVTPPDSTTASISAQITDWGGNTTKASAAYYVSASKPALVRFASTNSDGSYKVGDKITITMEYNKQVTFSGGTGASLLLNNGGTAIYDTSSNTNGTAKHNYIYTVKEDDIIPEDTKLDVTSISVNPGTVWKDIDGAFIENPTLLPEKDLKLKDVRSIYIDKTAPSLKSITPITSPGYYKAGKEIFIQVTFSEDVSFVNDSGEILDDIPNLKLNFQKNKPSDTVKSTDTVLKTSASTLLFKYTVKDGDNYSPLVLDSLTSGDLHIIDAAKNEMASFTLPDNLSTKNINLDTTKPSNPVIIHSFTSGATVYDENISFSISELEGNSSVKKYSVDANPEKGDNFTWEDYTSGNKTITTNGTYYITAYQEDAAGNRSGNAETIIVTLNKGELLNSISTSVVDGTYKESYEENGVPKAKEIPISLNFRIPVTISADSKLKLSIKDENGNYVFATYQSCSEDKKTHNYKYALKSGDSCDLLDVLGIYKNDETTEASILDDKNQEVSSWVTLDKDNSTSGIQNISVNRTIKVVTKPLNIETVELDQTGTYPILKLTFNADIVRSSGDIIIEQDKDTYIPPALLTEAEYLQYPSNIQAFYEEGTNGCDETGKSFLDKKYILKYEYDTKTNSVDVLKNTLIEAGALKVTASVKSLNTSIDGKVMSIVLKDGLALPVKGAEYKISIPLTIAKNMLGKTLTSGESDTTYDPANNTITRKIKYIGVEKPVIRINKQKEIISFNKNVPTTTQPLKASVKIDCQTPGASIYYINASKKTSDTNKTTYDHNMNSQAAFNTLQTAKAWTPELKNVTSGNTAYSNAFEVGSTSITDGFKVFINAKAFLENESSEPSYESAFRTVIVINTTPGNGFNYEWIRGGDQPSGGVSTPNFPISWNSKEYSKVRAMTKNGNQNQWYWISWSINTTAYIGFLSGDMPGDANTNGPKNWTWASCSWVPFKSNYPVFPGESYYFETNNMDVFGNGGFGYQTKHTESR